MVLGIHDRLDQDVPLGSEQARQIHRAKHPVRRIDDEDGREVIGQFLGFSHMVYDVTNGPERGDRHEIGLHQASGGLFRVIEVALDRLAVAGLELG